MVNEGIGMVIWLLSSRSQIEWRKDRCCGSNVNSARNAAHNANIRDEGSGLFGLIAHRQSAAASIEALTQLHMV